MNERIGKGILAVIPLIFFTGCFPFSATKKAPTKVKTDTKLSRTYSQVINSRCHFHTIRDWIQYGYAISPYSYKERFYKLQMGLTKDCLDKPLNSIDLGYITGSLADKEESCLGFTQISGDRYEIAQKLYEFLREKVGELCY